MRVHGSPWRLLLLALCILSSLVPAIQPRPARLSAQEIPLAEAPAPTVHAEAIGAARDLIIALVEEAGFPGLSIAVGIDGQVVWSEGFGYADVENRIPVTTLHRFRIGSVSKTLTSSAIALLHEQGRLDLDAPVQRYVPSFPEKRWPISTRQVAGHIAGIRHYRGDEFLSARHYTNVLEPLEIFSADTLLFRPGTEYSYSTYGWNLISAVVQGAADAKFLNYMRQNVLEPLGMRHTVADHVDSIIPYRVSFYRHGEDGRLVNAPYVDISNKWAGGGYLSTPEDLLRFGFAHLDSGFLRPQSIDLLFSPMRLESGEETGYGIGWRSGTDAYGRRMVGHTGGSVGGTTAFSIFPDQEMVVAVVVNLSDAPGLHPLTEAVGAFFFTPEGQSAEAPLAPGDSIGFTGRYALEMGPLEDGASVRGTLEIVRTPSGGYTGWFESDRGYARIAVVLHRDSQFHILGAGPSGLVRLWLTSRGDRISGKWIRPDGAVAVEGRRISG